MERDSEVVSIGTQGTVTDDEILVTEIELARMCHDMSILVESLFKPVSILASTNTKYHPTKSPLLGLSGTLIIIGESNNQYDRQYFERDSRLVSLWNKTCRESPVINETHESDFDCSKLSLSANIKIQTTRRCTNEVYWDEIVVDGANKTDLNIIIPKFICTPYKSHKIVFCGHGENGTGDWCLRNDKFSYGDLQSIIDTITKQNAGTQEIKSWHEPRVHVILVSCYSHHWQQKNMGSSPHEPFHNIIKLQKKYGLENAVRMHLMTTTSSEQIGRRNFTVNGTASYENPQLELVES